MSGDALPEWLIKAINERIRFHKSIPPCEFSFLAIQELNWVLSLKKHEGE